MKRKLFILLIPIVLLSCDFSGNQKQAVQEKEENKDVMCDTSKYKFFNLSSFGYIEDFWELSKNLKKVDSLDYYTIFLHDSVAKEMINTYNQPYNINDCYMFYYSCQKNQHYNALTILGLGEIESYLYLITLDSARKHLNRIDIASVGADAGYYWGSHGKFINDSTYYRANTRSCVEEFVEPNGKQHDTTYTIVNINYQGKITQKDTNNISDQIKQALKKMN